MKINQIIQENYTGPDDYEDCDACSGTGEGRWEGETCHACHGTGMQEPTERDDDVDTEDDWYDDQDEPESHYEKYVRVNNLEEKDNDITNRYRRRVQAQGFTDSPEERTSARQRANQRHQEYLDKMHADRMARPAIQSVTRTGPDSYDNDLEFNRERQLRSDDDWERTFDMMRDRINRHQSSTQRDVDPEQLKKITDIKYTPIKEDAGTDAKGRTQQQWIQAVKAKFPDAKIMQSKMIDGPCVAVLADGRKLSWNKVEQGLAEDAHGSEFFKQIVDNHDGDVRGIFGDLHSSGLHKNIQKFCEWTKGQGLASIYDGIELAKKIGLENDDENEFAYEGYLQAKDLLGMSDMAEGKRKSEPPEADYGDDYQAMVARVKKLAGLGPMKTVYDPNKRQYRNMPTAVQPKK